MVTPPEFRSFTISIHALREEGDVDFCILPPLDLNFNPRPPRGGRPRCSLRTPSKSTYFNPRPPRGGRPMSEPKQLQKSLFQSTPSARRATWLLSMCRPKQQFQSTPSARRATCSRYCAPDASELFQSTPSARRATGFCCPFHRMSNISIHALREESDTLYQCCFLYPLNFNPRPPRGERPFHVM